MDFKTEINVRGKVVRGQIKEDKLHLVLLENVSRGREEGIKPPILSVIVDKEWIDTAIEELKEIREKML